MQKDPNCGVSEKLAPAGNNILVSVVMPVHNSARFLVEALQSTLSQTLAKFELLIVDDGSTDSCNQIVRQTAAADARVRVLRQAHKGVVAARNLGVSYARADLVAFMDADDRMHRTRLATQVEYLRGCPDVALCCTWAHLINARGKQVGLSNHRVNVAEGIRCSDPSRFLEIVNPSVMFRKVAFLDVGGFRNGGALQDRDMLGRLVTSGYQIACIEQYLLDYRLHNDSITARNKDVWKAHYIDINVTRRSRGESEMSVEAYWEMRKTWPPLKRFSRWCDELSMSSYKRAVREFGEGQLLRCAATTARAAAFGPRWVLGRACSVLWP